MLIANTDHRPWPLPQHPWILAMQWRDLLFMHWPVPSATLRDHIPASLAIDTFDDTAWIGVVPFSMTNVRPRFVPTLPGLSAFPELNVRTYVIAEGKPGVWFFSLDAANPIAVRGARQFFHLPYYNARMLSEQSEEQVYYTSTRTHRDAPLATFRGQYRPCGPIYRAQPGRIEHWLTERYCLYAADRCGQIWRSDIHHAPWPLQPADAEIVVNTMTHQLDLTLPPTDPLLYFARRLDVVAWTLQRVG